MSEEKTSRLPRTQVRRKPSRQVSEHEQALEVLRSGRVAHVGVADEQGMPRVIPVAYGLEGDSAMLLHGSTASQLFRALAAGAPVCATVTMVDGLVVASSSFNSSMNYRSVMVFGRCHVVDESETLAVLDTLTEHLFPGRNSENRELTEQELKATMILRLPLDEISMKRRAEGVNEDDADKNPQRWTGVVPVQQVFGTPVPETHVRVEQPGYMAAWRP